MTDFNPRFPATKPLVLSARQERSRQTPERLLVVGRRRPDSGVVEGATVAGLAHKSGCAVGSVCSRFPDKDAVYSPAMPGILVWRGRPGRRRPC